MRLETENVADEKCDRLERKMRLNPERWKTFLWSTNFSTGQFVQR